MALAPGTRLGAYKILSLIGSGGMGEVYRARDTRLHREVAIKVLPSDVAEDDDRPRRFEQEARAAAALNHPNVFAVYDVGTHDGSPYIVSELLEGQTLRSALADGALPFRRATDYAVQICRGLAAAHESRIVHRDLQPENLFLTRDGRVKILDFGVAKRTQLFVRPLDALEPMAIATGTVLRNPFVSLDGQWVGFVESPATLKKVAITGGPALTIATLTGGPRGLGWAADDSIIFTTNNGGAGLERAPAAGGTPTVLAKPTSGRSEISYHWPELLPGGQQVLFTVTNPGGADAASIDVLDLRTGAQHVVFRGGSHDQYVTSGHLVYGAAGSLRAVPFDLKTLTVHGTPVPVVPRIVSSSSGASDFSVASDGTLVYVDAPGTSAAAGRRLVWVDRIGREEVISAPTRPYTTLSPDGMRVAVSSSDQDYDIWVWDFKRATLTRLTTEPGLDISPIWMPNGRRIIFGSDRSGARNLWWQAADNSDLAERLTTSPNFQSPTGITADGSTLIFSEVGAGATDLMRLPLSGDRKAVPLMQTKFVERNGVVSPDGHWLAYESDSTGRLEVYVRPFPNATAGLSQVSTAGGTRPLWAQNGKELFYVSLDNEMMRVSVEGTPTAWRSSTPVKLFDRAIRGIAVGRGYDVSPDGQRFLLIRAAGTEQAGGSPSIIVVQHFDEELKRLVPSR